MTNITDFFFSVLCKEYFTITERVEKGKKKIIAICTSTTQ